MMAETGTTGVSEPIGTGEKVERRQKWRRTLILGLLMAAGGITGFALATTQEDGAGFHQGAIPARVAIGLAALWLVSVVGGSFWLKRHIDEIEQAAQIWGIAIAGTVVIVLYPVWYLLWRGQMIAEPNAHILFGTLYVVMIAAYLWKKFR
jgi:hypothetical protein